MISVIISVYNAAPYIRRCIDSIRNQSYSDLEIIAVDDGSTDESGIICEDLAIQDKRIVVIHKKNGGNASARNAGIDAARGDFLTFVDADDYIESDMYEEMIKVMENPQVTIVSCGLIVTHVDGKDTIAIASNAGIYSREDALRDFFARRGNLNATACTKLVRKELFEKGVRFNNHVIHEDTEAMPRFIHAADHVYVMDKPFYHYVKRENSASTSKNFSLRGYHILDTLEEYKRMCKKVYPNLLPQFYQYKLYTTYEMYRNLVNSVDHRKYWRQAVKLRCQILSGFLNHARWSEMSKKYDDKEIMLQAIFGAHLFEVILRLKRCRGKF